MYIYTAVHGDSSIRTKISDFFIYFQGEFNCCRWIAHLRTVWCGVVFVCVCVCDFQLSKTKGSRVEFILEIVILED